MVQTCCIWQYCTLTFSLFTLLSWKHPLTWNQHTAFSWTSLIAWRELPPIWFGGNLKEWRVTSNFCPLPQTITVSVYLTGRGEQICVQSMDGQLSFFHHDTPTFSCFLPDFLLPGPLGYIQQTGSLVTVNSAHMLQVFKWVTHRLH